MLIAVVGDYEVVWHCGKSDSRGSWGADDVLIVMAIVEIVVVLMGGGV